MIKCANCGKELLGEVYRVDKGQFAMLDGRGVRQTGAIAHFLEEFEFKKRIGYFCSDCMAGFLISLLEGGDGG